MKPLLLAGALLSAVPVFAADAAKPAAKTEPKPQADFTFPERPPFHTVKPEPFDRLRTRMTNAVVPDVRTPEGFPKGPIPGPKARPREGGAFSWHASLGGQMKGAGAGMAFGVCPRLH